MCINLDKLYPETSARLKIFAVVLNVEFVQPYVYIGLVCNGEPYTDAPTPIHNVKTALHISPAKAPFKEKQNNR